MPVLTDGSSHRRGKLKVDLVLRWLGRWRFAPEPALLRVLAIKHWYHARPFLDGLIEKRLITVQTGVRSHPKLRVYRLGDFAQLARPDLELPSPMPAALLARHLTRDSIHHSFAMQHWALLQSDPWASVPVYGSDDATNADLRYTTIGGQVAIEVEHTAKSAARIYRTLVAYLEQLNEGGIQGVRYVFPTARIAQTYRDHFNAEAWPHYHYFTDTRRYAPAGDPDLVPANDPRRSRYSFEVTPLWPQRSTF